MYIMYYILYIYYIYIYIYYLYICIYYILFYSCFYNVQVWDRYDLYFFYKITCRKLKCANSLLYQRIPNTSIPFKMAM